METTTDTADTQNQPTRRTVGRGWGVVLRDVLIFQFKLVVDGLKDLCLAQVALGAAVVDVLWRNGAPGHRFYAVVRFSDQFDRWIDLHEPLERASADAGDSAPETAPDRASEDAPSYGLTARRSVDHMIERIEASARALVGTAPGGR